MKILKVLKVVNMHFRKRKFIEPLFWMILLVLSWELAVVAFSIPRQLIPSPSATLQKLFSTEEIWLHFSITLWEALVGFVGSSLLGMALAIPIAHSSRLKSGFYPIIVAFNAVPKVALAPIFVIWFGLGFLPKALICFLIGFFTLLVNGIKGLTITELELLDLMRSLKANTWQIFVKIRLPRSLPFIFSALKIIATSSVIGAVSAEVMSGDEGLGYLILYANWRMDNTLLFADIICMASMGLFLFSLVGIAEKLLLPWYKR